MAYSKATQCLLLLMFFCSCLPSFDLIPFNNGEFYDVYSNVSLSDEYQSMFFMQTVNKSNYFQCLVECSAYTSCLSVVSVDYSLFTVCTLLSNQTTSVYTVNVANSKVYNKYFLARFNESCSQIQCDYRIGLVCNLKKICICNNRISYWDQTPRRCVYYKNCHEAYVNKNLNDGVYKIWPNGSVSIDAYCYMKRGGWTLISEQKATSTRSFNRSWYDFEAGFGFGLPSYFIGLANMNYLTSVNMSLLIDVANNDAYTKDMYSITYDSFLVTSPTDGYKLYVSTTATGNLTNVLHLLNGTIFSSYDRYYNSTTLRNCARDCSAGWWFQGCYLYSAALTCNNSDWAQWYFAGSPGLRSSYKRFSAFRMMIKPSN